jgi:hypothetical protein
MRLLALILVLATGCSYAFVREPKHMDPPPTDPRQVHCNDSGLFPSLDALGGAAAISVAGGGVIIDQTSETGRAENFTKYYAAPLLALAIVYFYSGSFGTERVSKCQELKETAERNSRPSADIDVDVEMPPDRL